MYYSSYFCYLCSFSRFLSILRSSHTFFSYEYTKTYACHRQTTRGQQMFSLVQSCTDQASQSFRPSTILTGTVLYRPGQLVLQAQYNPHWYSLVQIRPVSHVGPGQSSLVLVQSCTDQASQSCRPSTILTGAVLYKPSQLVL